MKVCNHLDFFCYNSDPTVCNPCTRLITIKESVGLSALFIKVLSFESAKKNPQTHYILLLLKKVFVYCHS